MDIVETVTKKWSEYLSSELGSRKFHDKEGFSILAQVALSSAIREIISNDLTKLMHRRAELLRQKATGRPSAKIDSDLGEISQLIKLNNTLYRKSTALKQIHLLREKLSDKYGQTETDKLFQEVEKEVNSIDSFL